jgi:hypothetical protein
MTTEPTPADSTSTSVTEKPVPGPPPAAPSVETLAAPAPPAPPQAAPTWPLKADIAILGLLLILSFFLASFAATNSDLWLNLAIGKRISEGEFEFGVDPYSWATEATLTKPAVYWVHHSWLYSWLVYQLYSLAGGAGLVIGKAILFTAAIALLSRISFAANGSRRGPAGLNVPRLGANSTSSWSEASRWFGLICLVMAALAASNLILLRPLVVSLLFLSITLFVLHHAGIFALKKDEAAPDRARWLWSLPLLFALWANLDHWFILGPLLLALCWGGTGLAKWYPNGNPVPGKTIAAVLGVGVAACVLNPYHVRVFELPPELACVALSIADPLHIPLPDALVAAGRTIRELAKIEPNFTWTASPLSARYWQSNFGLNVAGLAFFPLLVLGLIAFTLVALVKPQPNAPTLQVSRFLPWLFFAALAFALYRMVPFFVLIAAPMTALTLGEFLLWQQTTNAVSAARRDRGLNLARLVSLPLMLLLLFLAWPGWLHPRTNEFSAPHRVAWALRPDEPLKRAAQSLHALKQHGQCRNVFNAGFDLANYLPWFAPDVKYFMDTRFSLYAGQAEMYEKARRALADSALPAEDWQSLFLERDIDQVAIVAFRTDLHARLLTRWWVDADHWQQRYADNRTLVFSWSGPGKSWELDAACTELNRQAFGEIPEDKRPPLGGAPPPRGLSFWTQYLDGVPPTPGLVGECNLQKARFIVTHEWMYAHYTIGSIMRRSQPILGIAFALSPVLEIQLMSAQISPPIDYGPPALPILMVRGARRAVAENPLDPACHKVLLEANETLRGFQEEHWAGQRSPLRNQLRQVQLVASVYNLVQLQPDNPDYHETLAKIYLQKNFRDLALDHFQQAYKGHEARFASGKYGSRTPKEKDAALKNYREKNIDPLDQTVRVRLAQFKETSEKLAPLQKVANALHQRFQEFGEKGKEETPLGLGKKAWDILMETDQTTLAKEEVHTYLLSRFDLALSMGRVDIVAEDLKNENVRSALPPAVLAQFELLAAAAVGDYQTMDQALALIEQQQREGIRLVGEEIKRRRTRCAPSMVLVPLQHFATGLVVGVIQTLETLEFERIVAGKAHNDLFNTKTLRGIVALEAGDTNQAREIFQTTLREAGSEHFFSDRPIARRYLDLLNQQR